MRKLKRSVARHKMIKAGMTKINKRPWVMDKNGMLVRSDSKFARNWKSLI